MKRYAVIKEHRDSFNIWIRVNDNYHLVEISVPVGDRTMRVFVDGKFDEEYIREAVIGDTNLYVTKTGKGDDK